MDRDTVEDVVHASLGRHLRVTCVLGLMFLAVGFVMGHYVAAQHARELSDRLATRADQQSDQIDRRVSELQEALKAELAEVRKLAQGTRDRQAAQPAEPLATPQVGHGTRQADLLSETRRLAQATEGLRQSLIARCIEQNELEKARILEELQPYLDRKMTIPATEVSEALQHLVETQVTQLKTLAKVEIPPTLSSDLASSLHSEIFPISGESEATDCPAPTHSPLIPIAEVHAPAVQEPVNLMPMPRSQLTRMPVPAEPTAVQGSGTSRQAQFFSAPRKPRLFIPARKPVEVSSAYDPVVR